ncbi:response regulator [Mucilaginibacter xinganensis]|nr:response regulator [Mucilaginibacter xinganensis]
MKNIIVISTDSNLAETLTGALPYNFTCAEAFEHPDQLFAQLNRLNPDLVIIDFMLDDLNGGGTVHQIKSDSRWRSLPVIILSEFSAEQMSNKFGSDAMIKKPFNFTELDTLIKQLL